MALAAAITGRVHRTADVRGKCVSAAQRCSVAGGARWREPDHSGLGKVGVRVFAWESPALQIEGGAEGNVVAVFAVSQSLPPCVGLRSRNNGRIAG